MFVRAAPELSLSSRSSRSWLVGSWFSPAKGRKKVVYSLAQFSVCASNRNSSGRGNRWAREEDSCCCCCCCCWCGCVLRPQCQSLRHCVQPCLAFSFLLSLLCPTSTDVCLVGIGRRNRERIVRIVRIAARPAASNVRLTKKTVSLSPFLPFVHYCHFLCVLSLAFSGCLCSSV